MLHQLKNKIDYLLIERNDIMANSPLKVAVAMDVARKTRNIVWQNIIFALVVKAAFIVLGIFGIATMWEAVFADMGVAMLAIFNAMRVLNDRKGRPGPA